MSSTPESPTPDSGAALELVDAEIAVEGVCSPKDEQVLTTLFGQLEGIHDFSFSAGKVLLEYDPVRINKRRISAAIQQAGYGVGEVEASIASPIVDALHD